MAALHQYDAEQTAIKAELKRIENDPNDYPPEAQATTDVRDTLIARYKEIDDLKAPMLERLAAVSRVNQQAAAEGGEAGTEAARGRGPEFMKRVDPFDDMQSVRRNLVTSTDLMSRAEAAIEYHNRVKALPDDRAETALARMQGRDTPGLPLGPRSDIARHMLMTGDDRYAESFRTYLSEPMGEGREAVRNLLTTAADGGYLLPYILDPTIVLSNNGSANPYRRIARVVQTTSNAWQGVNSAGIQGAWVNEGSASADNSPTVGQIQIFVEKAAAWVFGSYEVLGGPNAQGDTNFADQLPSLFADQRDILEEAAFATGTGGTAQPGVGMPKGILTAIAGTGQRVGAAGGTAGAFAGTGSAPAADIYNLQSALGARFRKQSSIGWVASLATINKARSLDVYGGSSFWANFGDDTPEQLLGKPIMESTSVPAFGTATGTGTGSAVLVHGAWENMIIVDRVGASMIYEPMVKAAGTATLPTGQAGWYYFWRVGSDVATANAFRYLTNG